MFSHPPTVCLCESWLSTIEKLRFRAEATQEWLEELGFSGPSRVCRAPELLGEMSPPSWGLGGSQDLQPPPPFPLPAVREVGRTAHLVTGDGPVGLQPWWSLVSVFHRVRRGPRRGSPGVSQGQACLLWPSWQGAGSGGFSG